MRSASAPVPLRQIVVFRLGAVELGVDVLRVREVVRDQAIVPVPKAPGFVEGVIDLRGTLLPVIDLRRRFDLPRGTTDEARIMIVDLDGEMVGLVVDAVLAVAEVPEAAIAAPPARVRGLASEYIDGLARTEERVIILVKLDRLLSSEERLELHQVELTPADTVASEPTFGPSGPVQPPP